ncbi:rRNA N-glycosidase [Hordeum vulgare]|nr:rRNA N-glycosidase [Hordeum vulgare]
MGVAGSHDKKTTVGGSPLMLDMFNALVRPNRSKAERRKAALRAIVIFCQAFRLLCILRLVIRAMESDQETPLEPYQWERINNWGHLCKFTRQRAKYGQVENPHVLQRMMDICNYASFDDIIGENGDLTLIMRDEGTLLDAELKRWLMRSGAAWRSKLETNYNMVKVQASSHDREILLSIISVCTSKLQQGYKLISNVTGPRCQQSTVHYSTGDCVTILDSTVHDWASSAAVCIFSGRGIRFFSAVVERLSRQRQSYCDLHCRCPPLTKQGRFWFCHHIRIYSAFFPCKAKLSDGSVQDIYRDTSVRLDVELADVDPQELESVKEKAVGNLVERIGESIVWGPEQEVSVQRFDNYYGEYVRIKDGESMVAEIDQQEGWACKQVTFYAELIDLQTNSRVGYVASKMAAQLEDDVWVSQKNSMLALLTEPTVVDDDTGIEADGEEGTYGARKIVVDWNVVELNEKIDLVIAPISDINMAEMFGIQVDDKDKEKDDSSLPADGNTSPRNANEDEEELMRMAADDVDDTNDNELVCLYDKENPVIEVGKLWPSMVEFRMSFRTYAVKKEFEAKTMWTDRKKFYARCKGYDGGGNACKWYISARLQPDGSTVRIIGDNGDLTLLMRDEGTLLDAELKQWLMGRGARAGIPNPDFNAAADDDEEEEDEGGGRMMMIR